MHRPCVQCTSGKLSYSAGAEDTCTVDNKSSFQVLQSAYIVPGSRLRSGMPYLIKSSHTRYCYLCFSLRKPEWDKWLSKATEIKPVKLEFIPDPKSQLKSLCNLSFQYDWKSTLGLGQRGPWIPIKAYCIQGSSSSGVRTFWKYPRLWWNLLKPEQKGTCRPKPTHNRTWGAEKLWFEIRWCLLGVSLQIQGTGEVFPGAGCVHSATLGQQSGLLSSLDPKDHVTCFHGYTYLCPVKMSCPGGWWGEESGTDENLVSRRASPTALARLGPPWGALGSSLP